MALNEFRPLTVRCGDNKISDNYRIRVQGSKNMTLLPDFFVVEIYNATDDDMFYLRNEKTLSVYGRDGGLLCSGEIDDMYTKLQNMNSITSISVVDGKSFWNAQITKSFGGGATVSDTFRNIVSGASVGAFAASDLRMIRGQYYSGRVAESVSDLAKSVHGRAYITNGSVFISTKGMAAETITINEEDVIDQTDNATGVRIVKTEVKGYPVGALATLSGNQYRLITQKFNADNFEGAWDSYLLLADENEISRGGMEGG